MHTVDGPGRSARKPWARWAGSAGWAGRPRAAAKSSSGTQNTGPRFHGMGLRSTWNDFQLCAHWAAMVSHSGVPARLNPGRSIRAISTRPRSRTLGQYRATRVHVVSTRERVGSTGPRECTLSVPGSASAVLTIHDGLLLHGGERAALLAHEVLEHGLAVGEAGLHADEVHRRHFVQPA
eukprot:3168919-Rhodomonas_salina.3